MKNIEYMDLFIHGLEAGGKVSVKTLEGYGTDIRQFINFVGHANVLSASTEEIQFYTDTFLCKYTDSTVLRKVSALNSFYGFLLSSGYVKCNPVDGILVQKKKSSIPKFLTQPEMKLLINAARKFNDNGLGLAVVTMLYSSGLKVSELLNIKYSSMKNVLESQCGDYVSMAIEGNKERVVIFNSAALSALRVFLKKRRSNSEFLFSGANSVGPLTRQRISQILKELAIASGMGSKKVSPNVIRHSFAVHMLNNNADISYVRSQLGHANISTTEIYTKLCNTSNNEE